MIGFNVHIEQRGAHVHARVFSGPPNGTKALSGVLVFTNQEWEFFKRLIESGDGAVSIRQEVKTT